MPNNRKLVGDAADKAVARYVAGESAAPIAKDLGVCCNVIIDEVRRRGLPVRKRKNYRRPKCLTLEQIDSIGPAYLAGESALEIAARLGTTKPNVYTYLKRAGIERRPISEACRIYAVNEQAFDPDPATGLLSAEQLYWIGFMMTDGNVCPDKRYPGVWHIQLSLQDRDRTHVEAFREFLGSTHPIRTIPARIQKFPTYDANSGPTATFNVTSKPMAESLITHGVVPAKSLTASAPPHIIAHPDAIHFWRGCIDGDGTVGIGRVLQYDRPHISLVGAKPLLEQFSTFIKTITPDCPASVRPHRNIWQLHVTGDNAATLIRHIYGCPGPVLKRKAESAAAGLRLHCEIVAKRAAAEGQRNQPCSVDGCGRVIDSKGLCILHYNRLNRYGRIENVYKDWSRLTREQLELLYAKHGKWARVARELGINRVVLAHVRKRLGVAV